MSIKFKFSNLLFVLFITFFTASFARADSNCRVYLYEARVAWEQSKAGRIE